MSHDDVEVAAPPQSRSCPRWSARQHRARPAPGRWCGGTPPERPAERNVAEKTPRFSLLINTHSFAGPANTLASSLPTSSPALFLSPSHHPNHRLGGDGGITCGLELRTILHVDPPKKATPNVGPGICELGFRSPATYGSHIAHDGHPELRGGRIRFSV